MDLNSLVINPYVKSVCNKSIYKIRCNAKFTYR